MVESCHLHEEEGKKRIDNGCFFLGILKIMFKSRDSVPRDITVHVDISILFFVCFVLNVQRKYAD